MVEKRLLTKRGEPLHPASHDNADHDLIIRVGDLFLHDAGLEKAVVSPGSVGAAPGAAAVDLRFPRGSAYEVLDLLGQGSFGQVVRCRVQGRDDVLAVKVIKNHSAYLHQAKIEIRILEYLDRLARRCPNVASGQDLLVKDVPDNSSVGNSSCGSVSSKTRCGSLTCGPCRIVQLLDCISYKQHLCLAFELLSSSLYDVVKQTQFKGVRLDLVRSIVTQVLSALTTLFAHRIMHCDLKPENILLQSPTKFLVKLIDFGSSCFEGETSYRYLAWCGAVVPILRRTL